MLDILARRGAVGEMANLGLGFKVDKTFTIANLIQIVLILFAIVSGSFTIYLGVLGSINKLQHTVDLVGRDVERQTAGRVAIEGRVTNLETRMQSAELSLNTYSITANNMQGQITTLSTKIDQLDTFLRSEFMERADGRNRSDYEGATGSPERTGGH